MNHEQNELLDRFIDERLTVVANHYVLFDDLRQEISNAHGAGMPETVHLLMYRLHQRFWRANTYEAKVILPRHSYALSFSDESYTDLSPFEYCLAHEKTPSLLVSNLQWRKVY